MTEWEARGGFRQVDKNPLYQNGSAHWKRWQEDFRLLKQIGVNAYRFSVEWARIEPERGQINRAALDQYERMIDQLLEFGIEPFLTLHHFTHPVWFHDQTPWTSELAKEAFCRYADILLNRFGDRIRHWITFNEPLVWVLAAYGDAKFPPGKINLMEMMLALKNMLNTHVCLYRQIKSAFPAAQVGIAKHFIIFTGRRNRFPIDRSLARLLHVFFNEMIPGAFKSNRLKFRFPLLFNFDEYLALDDQIDFWGVNYYYRMQASFRLNLKRPIHLGFKNISGEGLTDMGWEIYSEGLYRVLKQVGSYGKDIYITENGIATMDDKQRIAFVNAHIRQMLKAQQKGLPVRGYFYWSFLDNYEWLEGKSKRFGMVHVDYTKNFSRTLKPAALHYAQLISSDLRKKR